MSVSKKKFITYLTITKSTDELNGGGFTSFFLGARPVPLGTSLRALNTLLVVKYTPNFGPLKRSLNALYTGF